MSDATTMEDETTFADADHVTAQSQVQERIPRCLRNLGTYNNPGRGENMQNPEGRRPRR